LPTPASRTCTLWCKTNLDIQELEMTTGDDDKVVSLSEHRKKTDLSKKTPRKSQGKNPSQSRRSKPGSTPVEKIGSADTSAGDDAGGGKTGKTGEPGEAGGRVAEFGKGKSPAKTRDNGAGVPGTLIWLYCPTCQTIEYTEVEMPGGRKHNACGTLVQEVPIDLDLRAEYTLARVNLERLEILESLLNSQRTRYEEYQKRINLAAGRRLTPYDTSGDNPDSLGVSGVDALGLLISRFFHNPAGLFPGLKEPEDDSDPPPEGPEDPMEGA